MHERSGTLRPYDLAKSIFLSALELPAEQREAFVLAECAGDDALYREIRSLLVFHEETQELALSAAVLPSPTSVGDFTILRELGRGAMGVVLLAQRPNEPPVALKLLRPDVVSSELLARFQREGEVLARLDHPGIARAVATGVASTPQGARPWLAMEHVEGVNLREWAQQPHPLSARLELMARVADAVEHAHSQGVVHRDLKPENIQVRPDGSPVVLDFGVARLIDSDVRATTVMTSVGMLVGTIRYMSPEQAEADLEAIGPRSDVYTLGVVACELLSGRLPYDISETSVHRALVAVITAPLVPLVTVEPRARKPLERLLAAALAKRPSDRMASAAAFATDLRRIAAGRAPLARVPRRPRTDGRQLARWITALLSVGGIIALLIMAFRQPPTPMDWAMGALQPDRMFRRIMVVSDSAAVRIHYNTRTLRRLREARTQVEYALALTQTLRGQPYHTELRTQLLFRLGEARYLIAERTYDVAGFEAAARIWLSGREQPQPPPRFPTPDTIGISVHEVLHARGTEPWAAAAMALDDLARLDRAVESHRRALEIRREGSRLFARANGADSLEQILDPADHDTRNALAGWLQGVGTSQLLDGAARSDLAVAEEGLGLLRRAVRLSDRELDSSAPASRLHDLGQAYLWCALLGSSSAALDSAILRLREANEIRKVLPGYTSVVQSSCELARAFRLRAFRTTSVSAQRALLLEALAELQLQPNAEVRLGPLDQAMLGLYAAEVLVDLGCVERDSSRFREALEGLDRAAQLFPAARAPNLAGQAMIQRLRIEAQQHALTGSNAYLVRANQIISQGNLVQGDDGLIRWGRLATEARNAMEGPRCAPYVLTYPIHDPF